MAPALGAGGDDNDFAWFRTGVGFFEEQGLFEGVGVGFVECEFDVGEVDPFGAGADADAGIALRDLLNGYDDFHLVRNAPIHEQPCIVSVGCRSGQIAKERSIHVLGTHCPELVSAAS